MKEPAVLRLPAFSPPEPPGNTHSVRETLLVDEIEHEGRVERNCQKHPNAIRLQATPVPEPVPVVFDLLEVETIL